MLVKVVFEALYTVVFNYAQSRKPSFLDHSKNFAFCSYGEVIPVSEKTFRQVYKRDLALV